MLNLLMDGSSRPASELASAARVSPSTASEHLAALTEVGLLSVTSRGRQRFYRIKDVAVARALEQLGTLCPQTPVASYRQSAEASRLARARFCYDHLAGQLGVGLTESMMAMAWLEEGTLEVTHEGLEGIAALGINVHAQTPTRRPLCRPCLDWTERRAHVGGRLGALLAEHVLASGWVRRAAHGRGLTVTEAGSAAFTQHWGITI